MYERFYNLRERPFSLSPDPDYLYPSRVHKEALSYLRYGIEVPCRLHRHHRRHRLGQDHAAADGCGGSIDRTSVARLVSTMLDARELIEAVMLDFGLDPAGGREANRTCCAISRRFLVEQRPAGRLALLVIDEAQNLSLAALEEVRMLSNLETEKSKLIQIALIGQPNLHDVLGRPELEQLRQRVTVRYHLQPLDPGETAAYVNHRLRRAAIGAPLEFSSEVTDLIHLLSQGIPRKINVIADAILLFGYGEGKRTIDAALVREAIDELEAPASSGPHRRPRPRPRRPCRPRERRRGYRPRPRAPSRARASTGRETASRGTASLIRRLNSAPSPVAPVAQTRHRFAAAPAPATVDAGRADSRSRGRTAVAASRERSSRPLSAAFRNRSPPPVARREIPRAAHAVRRAVRRRLLGTARPLVNEPAAAIDSLLDKDSIHVSLSHNACSNVSKDRQARVGVVGLGYVGLPLAVEFAQAGFDVTGIDLDKPKSPIAESRRILHPRRADVRAASRWSRRASCAPPPTSPPSPSSTPSTSASPRRCARPKTRT